MYLFSSEHGLGDFLLQNLNKALRPTMLPGAVKDNEGNELSHTFVKRQYVSITDQQTNAMSGQTD